ncbi:hypothetical protein BSU04_25440 [Caballeronia sordidicola]|uniref:Uncharacterized protein n=1 Tax=Caballeronia sordidicola TaxID=196367 RepID=A0A226WWL6_CABSO|nr:hypothetical protein BSU04_25440 [Caballeronia sordidicola]
MDSPPYFARASPANLSIRFGSAAKAIQEGYTPSGVPLLRHHDEAITLRDHRTQRPLPNVQYRLRDGSQLLATGVTDANGRTERVVTDAASNLLIEIYRGAHTTGTRR